MSDNSLIIARLQIGAKEVVINQSSSFLNRQRSLSWTSMPSGKISSTPHWFAPSLHHHLRCLWPLTRACIYYLTSIYLQRTSAWNSRTPVIQSRLPSGQIVNQTAREKISLNALRSRLRCRAITVRSSSSCFSKNMCQVGLLVVSRRRLSALHVALEEARDMASTSYCDNLVNLKRSVFSSNTQS